MHEKIESHLLAIGMFVADLDRPWLESPFFLQGFLVEDEDTLSLLKDLCKWVMIDRSKSTEEHQKPVAVTERENLKLRSDGKTSVVNVVEVSDNRMNFSKLLRNLKNADATELEEISREAKALLADLSVVNVETELAVIAPAFNKVQSSYELFIDDLQKNIPSSVGPLAEGIEEMVGSAARNPDALLWLTRLKQRDQYTYDHAIDVSIHVIIFARSLGWTEEDAKQLGLAGLLLDIGKIKIPERLHTKQIITALDREIFKTHVDFSVQALKEISDCPASVVAIVGAHHERTDGSGYPLGLLGEDLSLAGEMAGLVDVYCAMMRARGYGEVMSSHQALEELIRMRSVAFRDSLVDQWVQCVGIYPVGSLVELNTGEVAVVTEQNRVRRLQPRVMVVLEQDKTPCTNHVNLNLMFSPKTPSGADYRIMKALPVGAYGIDANEFYL